MRLLAAILALALAPQEAKLRDLIEKLEDDRVETREQAQKELGAFGEAALPVLRAVVESPRSSGELKLRAGAAVREIELSIKASKVYREPRRITIQASGKPLREVLDEIARQAEVKFDAQAVDPTAPVTLDVKGQTLFQVLDQLCKGQDERSWEAREEGAVRLIRERHVPFPTQYAGPFRIRVQSMNQERNTDFKARTAQLTVVLEADSERYLKPSKGVDLEILRATDDKGATLEVQVGNVNMPFIKGAPGARIIVRGGVFIADAAENGRTFTFRNLTPGAGKVNFEGLARFTFPLDAREIKFEKLGERESRELGDTLISLRRLGASGLWSVSFQKAKGSAESGWAQQMAQRVDATSLVVVDQEGQEFEGRLIQTTMTGRQFLADGTYENLVSYQTQFQVPPTKPLKELRFKFVDQTVVKTVPFKFVDVELP